MDNYFVSNDKSKLDIKIIHEFLTNSYWSANIPEWIVKKAIENSLCFGIYNDTTQVGFARVITDYTSFAYLADVFIIEEQRGKGLSKMLIQEIISSPQLKTIRKWMLATRDAHGLYSKFGFKPVSNPDTLMEIFIHDYYNTLKPEETEKGQG